MPAGSGPQAIQITGAAVGTSEGVIAQLPPGNWNTELGTLIEFSATFAAPATAGTLVLKVRQGTTVAGVQVGSTFNQSVALSATADVSIAALDASPFGLAQQGGQYCVTAQYAAATGGTLSGVATQETVAPIQ
jgi:hypothetical protein